MSAPTRHLFRYLIVLGLCGAPAYAQDPGNYSIEGHVFDARTGRPLKDIDVLYEQFFAGTGVSVGTRTDANGFYQIEGTPSVQTATSYAFFVVCHSKRRGDLRYDTSFYGTVRAEVYRRDFYITLPKGVSNCNP